MRILYGNAPATAHFDTSRRWLSVHLDSDPGAGSMTFHRISPAVVTVVTGDAGDVQSVAACLRESVRYLTPGPTAERLTREAARLEVNGPMTVHLHAATAGPGETRCLTVCGRPCGTRETTAYRGLDPERVTCPGCLPHVP